MPAGFKNVSGGIKAGYDTGVLKADQVEVYLELAERLKKDYATRINISVGLKWIICPDLKTIRTLF